MSVAYISVAPRFAPRRELFASMRILVGAAHRSLAHRAAVFAVCAIFISQLVDVQTTVMSYAKGHAEANPFTGAVIAVGGFSGLLAFKLLVAAVVSIKAHELTGRTRAFAVVATLAITGAAIANNVRFFI